MSKNIHMKARTQGFPAERCVVYKIKAFSTTYWPNGILSTQGIISSHHTHTMHTTMIMSWTCLLWCAVNLLSFQWLCSPSMQQQRRTLCGDAVCFLFITPLASLSGWLCIQGAMDLYFTNGMEALGLLVLTLALFTIYVFWTVVCSGSMLLVRTGHTMLIWSSLTLSAIQCKGQTMSWKVLKCIVELRGTADIILCRVITTKNFDITQTTISCYK